MCAQCSKKGQAQQHLQRQPRPSASRARAQGRYRPPASKADGEYDPMDPTSYSDAPPGGWSQGLNPDDETATKPAT